MLVYVELTMIR